MQIRKLTESFDSLILAFDGHIRDGIVIPSNVNTILHVNIAEVGYVYDQLLALGNVPDETVSVTINQIRYTFDRKMAIDLMHAAEQIWFEYEIGDAANILPEEEWTEEYLLSL